MNQTIHYGKKGLCRATICTAKGAICTEKALPCDAARQRSHGNAIDGKGFFAVRLANVARQRLCRVTPHGKGRFFVVWLTCFI
jgi:hypothetical protein